MTHITLPIPSILLSRLSLGACLALLTACPPDTGTTVTTSSETDGSGTDDTGPATGTSAPTTSGTTGPDTTGPDTTGTGTTGPAPVCGDGVVDDGEACDDGNDVTDDGCNSNCEPTAAIVWTKSIDFAKKSDGASDVTVDATGRIVIAGWATDADGQVDQMLMVLDPDGNEVWKKTFDGAAGLDDALSSVAVDDQGRIFAGGNERLTDKHSAGILRAVTADGEPLWLFAEPNVELDYAEINELVIAGDAIYSVGLEELDDKGAQMIVRRHDPAMDGAAAWRVETKADMFYAVGEALTLAGEELVVVGRAGDSFNSPTRPLIARVSTAGVLGPVDVENSPDGIWFDIKPIGDAGDLLLAGRRVAGVTLGDAALRRITADGVELWTDIYDQDFLYDTHFAIAVGPDEAILAGGASVKAGENDNALVRRLAGDGTVRWTSLHNNPDLDLYEVVSGAAFGPDFAVVAGRESVLGQSSNVWVRRYEAD